MRALSRRAKYLLAELESGDTLLMHLGMSGSFRVVKGRRDDVQGGFYFERSRLEAHDHVLFTMSSGATIVFNDPRRFGVMNIIPAGSLTSDRALSALGPEPLDRTFDAASLARALKGRRRLSRRRSPISGSSPDWATSTSAKRFTAPAVTQTARLDARDRGRRASACREGADRRHSSRAEGGDREQASTAGERPVSRVRSRGSALSEAWLPRHDQADRADGTIDVFLSGLSAVGTQALRCDGATGRGCDGPVRWCDGPVRWCDGPALCRPSHRRPIGPE